MPTVRAMNRCDACHMVFQTPSLLHKHKDRFCLGTQPGKQQTRDWIRHQDTRNSPGGTSYNKIAQLQSFKERQAFKRAEQDRHDQYLLQSMGAQDTWQHKAHDLRELKGFARHQGHQYYDQGRPDTGSSLSTNSSMTINLPSDDEASPRRATRDKVVLDLQQHCHALEEQNNAMQTKLNNITLTERLQPTVPQPDLKEYLFDEKPTRKHGASVAEEISALRTRYLKQGGSDVKVLSQMAELELEALSIEIKNKENKKHKSKFNSLQDKYLSVQEENKRLQNKLERIRDESENEKKPEPAAREDLSDAIRMREQAYLKSLEEKQRVLEMERQHAPSKVVPPLALPQPLSQQQYLPNEPYEYPPYEPPMMSQRFYQGPTDLLPAPYDPQGGLMIFYDFLIGLDPSIQCCRLVSSLYNQNGVPGEVVDLEVVNTEGAPPSGLAFGPGRAMMKLKQPLTNCQPDPGLSVVIALQAANYGYHYSSQATTDRAWCKLDLFDQQNRLLSGRWRLLLRNLPIKSTMPTHLMNSIQQFGLAELYIRVVNYRDVYHQSLLEVKVEDAPMYQYPSQPVDSNPHYTSHHNTHRSNPAIPPPPSTEPPNSPAYSNHPTSSGMANDNFDYYYTIGFQIDKVKHAEMGEAKVRLTAYYAKSGKVVQSASSPVTCSTIPARSGFRHNCHVFGQQEAIFHDIKLKEDMILIARFYLRRRAELFFDDLRMVETQDLRLHDDETLVAWTALPLMVPEEGRYGRSIAADLGLNVGTHTLALYETPVPNIAHIPLEPHLDKKPWQRYNHKASLKILVFDTVKGPNSVASSLDAEHVPHSLPDHIWVHNERRDTLIEPFKATDGFDLYIDGCRGLPDSVTITKIVGQIQNRKYEKVGKYFHSEVKLDADIYNPVYDHRVEFREPNMPPSSTLLLKLYTLDRFSGQLMSVGYATLNVFVETGSYQQPSLDTGGIQLSLNEGGHQLRVYHKLPSKRGPCCESFLRDAGIKHIPCATVLIRIVKAPTTPNGQPLQADKVPQIDWYRLGLWHARPDYSDGSYYSMSCVPAPSERRLYEAMHKRSFISVQESLRILHEEMRLLDTRAMSRNALQDHIRTVLTKGIDIKAVDIDMTYITKYDPDYGVKVALDAAMNLPWGNFTHATFCLNPPAAFYMGTPNASYDKPVFTKDLDFISTNRSPRWIDGYHSFSLRSHNPYMSIIVHLQEIAVEVTDQYKYSLNEQAWTVMPVFTNSYANTGAFQLPLFTGAPKIDLLRQIAVGPVDEWIERNIENQTLHLADGASILLRTCDGRRDDEYEHSLQFHDDYTDKKYLSKLTKQNATIYNEPITGQQLNRMIPPGKREKEFNQLLASKFKMLVYKLYEEGNI